MHKGWLRIAVTPLVAGFDPASAQPPQSRIVDFLATIGGDTSMRTIGSSEGRFSPEVYPLRDNRSDILGYRFFRENLRENGSATAERARAAFARECAATGGQVEPENSAVAQRFYDRTLWGKPPARGGDKHFWIGRSAVCSGPSGRTLGGFVAVTDGSMEVATKGDLGSRLPTRLTPTPTCTAVYANAQFGIKRRVAIETAETDRAIAHARENERAVAFRRDIDIDTETNCGTVTQVGGLMVEVAVPPTRTTHNGQSSFWSKRERLFPPTTAGCTFGL